ncbi:hypothetical protein QZH41_007989, partial [Actinostola sp. cb2023]
MQDEVLRVNASRLNAEQEKTKLQQDNHFKEDEIFVLREKLSEALEDREEIQRCVGQTNSKTNNGDVSFPSFDEEDIELQNRCDTYRAKLQDKEKFISAMKRDQQEMIKGLDVLKKELAEANNETQRMKKENERLQRENADRDIHRLSTESSAKASNSRINQLKDKIADAEFEIKELQRKCEESEIREAALSHEVLSNLEKYTQAEQELYATKKELAHLRGFSESSERHKDEMQRDLLSARENTARLQKELRAKKSKYPHSSYDNMDDLESDNRQLKEDITQLDDALNSSKLEVNQLENDMESLREQCSIQTVRLDGQETMVMRKDERIKELQDELVDLHNQNDALTDEILKKHRDYKNLKMGNLLAEQERDLLRTGKVPTRGPSYPHKDTTSSFTRLEPLTPDSGYYETDVHRRRDDVHRRQDDVHRRHDDVHRRRDDRERPLLLETPREDNSRGIENERYRQSPGYEGAGREAEQESDMQRKLNKLLKENAALKEEKDEMSAAMIDMQTGLTDMEDKIQQSGNRERMMKQQFEEKEDDMLRDLNDIKQSLSDLQEENSELKGKGNELEQSLDLKENSQESITSPHNLTLNDELDALESAPVIDLWDFDKDDSQEKELANVPVHVHQEQVQGLEASRDNNSLIDFEAFLQRSDTEVQKSPNHAAEDMKEDIKTYEVQIESISEDKKELQAELEQVRELLEQTECKLAKQQKDGVKNYTKEIAAKDQRVTELEKELNSTKPLLASISEDKKELEAQLEQVRKLLEQKQHECKLAKQEKDGVKNYTKEIAAKDQRVTELEKALNSSKPLLASISEDKKELEAQLEQVRKLLEQKQHECKLAKQEKDGVNNNSSKEIAAKDQRVTELVKELTSTKPLLASISEDKKELEAELEQVRKLLEQTQNDCKLAKQEKDGVNNNSSKEIAVKDQRVDELEKELNSTKPLLASISEDKKELEAELEKVRKLLDKKQHECKLAKKEKDAVKNNSSKEIAVKDQRVAELEKELTSTKPKCDRLKSHVEDLEKRLEDKDESLHNAQAKYSALEGKAVEYKNKYEEMKDIAEKAKEEEYDLVNDLELTKAKLIDVENEVAESQGETMDTVGKCRELQRQKRNMEEDMEILQKEKSKIEKKLKEFEQEKDEISLKFEETKRNVKELKIEQRRLQEEKDDLDFDLNEMLKLKNREIKKLVEDLEVSEHNYEDLNATLGSSEVLSSDLKSELSNVKEDCTDLTKKNEKLYEFKKELVKELEDKEKLIANLRNTEEELRNGINSREKELEKLHEKSKELRGENTALQEESDELRKVLDLTNDEQKAVDTYVEKLRDDFEKVQNQLQEDQAKLSLLGETAEKSEHENSVLQDKLNKVERRLLDVQKREENAQTGLVEAEKRAKAAERKGKELIITLNKSKEDLSYLQNKLTKAEHTILSLEESQSTGEEQQKILQRKLVDATNQINDLTAQEKDNEDRQRNIDKRITDLRDYSEEVEAERDDLEFTVKELKKKLEKQKKKLEGIEDDLESKQMEKDYVAQELDLLKRNLSDTESEQNTNLTEKEKLKKDMLEASKMNMDLEAENDAQKENIEELEKTVGSKTSNRARFGGQCEGNIGITYAEILKLAFSHDDAEDTIVLLKKDLSRREGVNKANREELEDVEKQLVETNKKLLETKSANVKVLQENERLQKELDNAKRKLIELDGIQGLNVTDGRIKTLDDKLTKAQTKVTDLENELSKEIRRHEIDCMKTRPTLPFTYGGKRSGFYDVSGINNKYGLPKRSESSDSEISSNTDDYGGKSRGSYKTKKSMDSTVQSLDRGSDVESKGIEKSISVASSSPPPSPVISVFSYDSSDKRDNQDGTLDNPMDSLNIQTQQHNDSSSDVSSRGDDEVFEHSVGNLNDLISEMNEAEKHDPILQQFLLDQAGPDGTSSPRNDSFDAIQPTYLTRREESKNDLNEIQQEESQSDVNASSSDNLFDIGSFDTASDITTVTDVVDPVEKQQQQQLLLDFDSLAMNKDKQTNDHNKEAETVKLNRSDVKSKPNVEKEGPGVIDGDQSSDVIDPFLTPFDIPNWDDELDSSLDTDSSRDLLVLGDDSQSDNQVLILINDKEYGNESTTDENLSGKDNGQRNKVETKTEIDVGNDLIIEVRERDNFTVYAHDQVDSVASPKFKEITVDVKVDDDENESKRSTFEDKSRPRQDHKPTEPISEDISETASHDVTKKPDPKPRRKHVTQSSNGSDQETDDDSSDNIAAASAPVPKQRRVSLERTSDESTEE